jgi:predicted nuclease with TOPRIM domain
VTTTPATRQFEKNRDELMALRRENALLQETKSILEAQVAVLIRQLNDISTEIERHNP